MRYCERGIFEWHLIQTLQETTYGVKMRWEPPITSNPHSSNRWCGDICTNMLTHKARRLWSKWRWLTTLYARGSSRERDVIHLDSDASGGLKGAVTVGVQSKYWSAWLATKHYRWKRSYLKDMCVCLCRGMQYTRWQSFRGCGCKTNSEQLRAKFEYRLFVKAELFYILVLYVCFYIQDKEQNRIKQDF